MKLITTLEVSIVLMTLYQVSGQPREQRTVDTFDCGSFASNGPFCVKPKPNARGSFIVNKPRFTDGTATAGPAPFCNDNLVTTVNGVGTCCDKKLKVPTTLTQAQINQKCGNKPNGVATSQTNQRPKRKN